MAKAVHNLTTLPPFDVDNDIECQGQRWTRWVERFEVYIVAMGIDDDAQKRALLLHTMGERAYDVFATLANTGNDYATAKLRLTARFAPQQNTEFAKFKFREAKQEKGETLDSFHTRLRQLAKICNFGDAAAMDAEIKSQLIHGCASTKLRKKGLTAAGMTLAALIDEGRAAELSAQQASGIERAMQPGVPSTNVTQTVQYVKRKQDTGGYRDGKGGKTEKPSAHKQQNSNNARCRNCGSRYPHEGGMQNCPAHEIVCRKCNRMGHFQRWCMSNVSKKSVYQISDSESEHEQQTQKTLYYVSNAINVPESESSDEEVFFLSANHVVKRPRFRVTLSGSEVNMNADTCATCNLIDQKTYECMSPKPDLEPTKVKIKPYGAGKRLVVAGQFKGCVEYHGKRLNDVFYVVPSGQVPILSFENSQKLGLIKVSEHVNESEYVNAIDGETKGENPVKYMDKHPELFNGVGKLKGYQVTLNIDQNVVPVAHPHRRIPFHSRKKLETELKRLENENIIEKVDGPTPWVSPVVIVPKPKNPSEIRMCVDMRCPNTAIVRERHIMPTVHDIQNELNGSNVFSKLDLKNAYHQLELDKASRSITTFSTHVGLRRFKRLSYGINSASEKFQQVLSHVISDIQGAMNISDDIIVHGKSQKQHDQALLAILQKIVACNLTLNKSKCAFNRTSVEFYGFVFSGKGVSPDPHKVEALFEMPEPKTKQEVQSLLGMVNYSARFIPDYSTVTEPIRKLTRKDSTFLWGTEQQEAFERLKFVLAQNPVLAYFDTNARTEVVCDASPVGIGAMLVQCDKNDNPRVVAYGSRSLTDVEQRYSQIEREALAVVWSCEHFHLYTYGQHITVVTDHQPLLGMYGSTKAKLPARLERWALRLQLYDYDLVYRKGKDNPADYLSRHPRAQSKPSSREQQISEEYVSFVTRESMPKAMTLEQVQNETLKDSTLQTVMDLVYNGQWHRLSKVQTNYKTLLLFRNVRNQLTVNLEDGILLKGGRIVLPFSLQELAVDLAHEGHQGINKTKALLREKVWFPGIDGLVLRKVEHCGACKANEKKPKREPLCMTRLPKGPWQEVSADFCGPFPQGDYILVVQDDYSRYPEVDTLTSTSAAATIPKFNRMFATHGIPEVVRTDNGSPFQSKEFHDFAGEQGFKHRKVTPRWPEANGQAESFMKPLGKVCKAAQLEGKPWKSEMYSFLRNYRATPHCSTGEAPAKVLFGRSIKTKLPQVWPVLSDQDIRSRDTVAKAKMKANAEHRRNIHISRVMPGDTVLIKNDKSGKLEPNFSANPYQVIERRGSMIIAKRGEEIKARNSSHVQPMKYADNPSQECESLPVLQEPIPNVVNPPNSQPLSQPVLVQNIPSTAPPMVMSPARPQVERSLSPEKMVSSPRKSGRDRKKPVWAKDYIE
jgi:transposase InsO family protein